MFELLPPFVCVRYYKTEKNLLYYRRKHKIIIAIIINKKLQLTNASSRSFSFLSVRMVLFFGV